MFFLKFKKKSYVSHIFIESICTMGKISHIFLKWITLSCHSDDILPFSEAVRFRKVREMNWNLEKVKWFYKRKHLIWSLCTGSWLHLYFRFCVFCLYYQYHVWFNHCIFMYHNNDMASSILNNIYLPTINIYFDNCWKTKNSFENSYGTYRISSEK